MTKPKWVVEKGSIEDPEYLNVIETGWTWGETPLQFDSEEDATRAAVETRVEALRVTEWEA